MFPEGRDLIISSGLIFERINSLKFRFLIFSSFKNTATYLFWTKLFFPSLGIESPIIFSLSKNTFTRSLCFEK